MKMILPALCLMLLLTACAPVSNTVSADNPLIEYTGRIDFSNPLAPRFSYSGVSIRAAFSGTGISAILDDDTGENYYNVLIDGEVLNVLHVTQGRQEYVLGEGLENTTHEVELFKRTELTFGKTTFHGFVLPARTKLVPVQNERALLFEFIGNSITCGYGNEGPNGDVFGPTTENHFLTYAAITSRNFNARHLAVCRSGIGIYRNWDGPPEGNTDNMPNNYGRIFLYDSLPLYNFPEQPDLICINLGTNDFSTNGGDSALYVSNYFRMIDTLRSHYEKPEIVILQGSMMNGTDLDNIRRYLRFVADSAGSTGNGRVTFFEMSAQTGDLGIGIDWHPSVEQHRKNAGELTEYIRELKGWETVGSK